MFPIGSAHPHIIKDLEEMGVPKEKIYITSDGFAVISNYAELPNEIIQKIKEKYEVDYIGYFLRDMVIVQPRGEKT